MVLAEVDYGSAAQWAGFLLAAIIGIYNIVNARTQASHGRLLEDLQRKAGTIDKLQEQLEEKAEELVEMKLAAKTGELQGLLRETKSELENVRRELANGRERMQRMTDRDREIELQLLKEIGTVREQMATREDLNKLWDAVNKRKGELVHA